VARTSFLLLIPEYEVDKTVVFSFWKQLLCVGRVAPASFLLLIPEYERSTKLLCFP
jgi:hypothetical protein